MSRPLDYMVFFSASVLGAVWVITAEKYMEMNKQK